MGELWQEAVPFSFFQIDLKLFAILPFLQLVFTDSIIHKRYVEARSVELLVRCLNRTAPVGIYTGTNCRTAMVQYLWQE